MGKSSSRKKKSTSNPLATDPPPPSPRSNGNGILPSSSDPDFLKRAHELKEEGNRLFQTKDYPAALERYARALSLLPGGHPEGAVFHSNRAACLMQVLPVDYLAVEAECSLALQLQPLFPRALFRRARALAALRRPDLALEDVRSLLSVDPSNPEALDLHSKLLNEQQQHRHHDDVDDVKSTTTTSSSTTALPSPAVLGAQPVQKESTSPPPPTLASAKIEKMAPAAMVPPCPDAVLKPPNDEEEEEVEGSGRMRPLKLVYDHDIRLAEMPERCGFRVLREVVGKSFPCLRAVLIKYRDEDGDLVTVTSTRELRLAEDQGVDKHGVLRLHVVKVTAEQEPVLADDDKEVPVQENDPARSSVKNGPPPPKEKEKVKINHWLYDFVQLLKQQFGDRLYGFVHPVGDWLYKLGMAMYELGMEMYEMYELGMEIKDMMTEEEVYNLFFEPLKDTMTKEEVKIKHWLYDFVQLLKQQVGDRMPGFVQLILRHLYGFVQIILGATSWF